MCNNNCGCNNNGFLGGCNEWIIILIILFFFCNCGGCNLFSGGSNCGCGCNNNNNCGGGCGCDNNCGCGC